jgi:acyl carrier protein
MTIDVSKEHEIRRLHDVEKWKRGTIASELGVHPDVVDRVLDRGADRALVAAPRPSLVDPYVAFIDETLKSHPPPQVELVNERASPRNGLPRCPVTPWSPPLEVPHPRRAMMFPSIHSVALGALARHIRRDIGTVRTWHSLDGDLHLTPLELVIIALEIQDAAGVEVSLDELASLETVGDFFMCLSKTSAYSHDARACA